jgi:hypothetical protein
MIITPETHPGIWLKGMTSASDVDSHYAAVFAERSKVCKRQGNQRKLHPQLRFFLLRNFSLSPSSRLLLQSSSHDIRLAFGSSAKLYFILNRFSFHSLVKGI